MWMLLSPNKVFCLELRPSEMTSPPGVVPGDCLYTRYTQPTSVCLSVCVRERESQKEKSEIKNNKYSKSVNHQQNVLPK